MHLNLLEQQPPTPRSLCCLGDPNRIQTCLSPPTASWSSSPTPKYIFITGTEGTQPNSSPYAGNGTSAHLLIALFKDSPLRSTVVSYRAHSEGSSPVLHMPLAEEPGLQSELQASQSYTDPVPKTTGWNWRAYVPG